MTSQEPLEICDAHHHLWDRPHHHPEETFMVEDLRRLIAQSGLAVTSSVYVECGVGYRNRGPEHLRPVGEIEYMVGADSARFVAAFLGYADIRSPALEETLAAHIEAGSGRFRGLRQVVAWHPSAAIPISHTAPPPHLLMDKSFRNGVGKLAASGLSLDVWCFHTQLAELADLARHFPELTIVVDHLGGPLGIGPYADTRQSMLAEWRVGLEMCARNPNVKLKLGGLGMPVMGSMWRESEGATSDGIVRAWGRDVTWCIDTFSPERCMFESNFPVDAVSYDYAAVWQAFKSIAEDYSPSEQRALFRDTARQTYRLP